MNERKDWHTNVMLSFVVVLLLMWTTVADGRDGEVPAAPSLGEPTIEEVLFYLSRIDTLTVDLEQCEERLAWAEEDPPECGGVGWLTLALVAGVGFGLGLLAD